MFKRNFKESNLPLNLRLNLKDIEIFFHLCLKSLQALLHGTRTLDIETAKGRFEHLKCS